MEVVEHTLNIHINVLCSLMYSPYMYKLEEILWMENEAYHFKVFNIICYLERSPTAGGSLGF